MPDLPPGSPPSGGRFTILRLHAQGGLGQVSVARDEKLKRQVALKEIRADKRDRPELHERFLAEAEITGQLEHPGIVPIYDLEEGRDGQVRYAMRFIQGRTLREAIADYHQRPSPLAFRGLLQRFVSVCETIAYAHSQGVIHRDLKPANVILGDYGETLVVDWGLAKRLTPLQGPAISPSATALPGAPSAALDETTDFVSASTDDRGLTQAGQILGTPAYMAPEQARGEQNTIGKPADVYGLGAILYEILTGQFPSQGKEVQAAMVAVCSGQHLRPGEIRRGVPRALEAICLKAMAPHMADRYSGARELAGDVERWLADEPVSAFREPVWSRFARWRRRHRTPVIAAAVLLVTAVVVGSLGGWLALRERRRAEAVGKVEALREATPAAASFLVSTLDTADSAVQARLQQYWNQPELPASQRRRMGLALLRIDAAGVHEPLVSMLLDTEDPVEFLLVRDALAPHLRGQASRLWREVEQSTDRPRKFRLLAALATCDPASDRWTSHGPWLADELLAANSLHLGAWSQALAPARNALIPPLLRIAKLERESDRGAVAATILTEYAAVHPGVLLGLLLESSPRQHELVWRAIAAQPDLDALLRAELERHLPEDATDGEHDALVYRQANAAIGLLRLNQAEFVWPLLRASPQPRLRSALIHRLAALRIEPRLLTDRYAKEGDVSVRRALLLALGEYSPASVSEQDKLALRELAAAAGRDDPDAGIHSAAEWLLARLGADKPSEPAQPPTPSQPMAERNWYVHSEGHTLAILRGPLTYPRARFVKESSGEERQVLETETMPYSLAVSMRKVTLAQLRRFLRQHPDRGYPFTRPRSGDGDLPATQVTWLLAAKYCRWLSELDQIAEDQMCFPEMDQIQEGLELPEDYVRHTGYRLPTKGEWECFCRAGTTTRLSFGSDLALLRHYGWHAENSARELQPVGLLKPNDIGLFDTYGLAYEWCSDRVEFSPGVEERVFCGSSRFSEASHVASASSGVLANRPTYLGNECGLRIVRTLPAGP